jgi:Na+/H+ antiporter NhaD/arsenite permease-like protein
VTVLRLYRTTPSQGSSGGWRHKLAGPARGLLRERLLLVLLALYIALCLLDHSLPRRSLALLEPRIYASLVALLALYALLLSRHLGPGMPRAPQPPPVRVKWRLAVASLSSILALLVMGHYGLQYAALALTVALIVYADPHALRSIDLSLLLVFALFFIDFGEASRLVAPHLEVPGSPAGLVALAAGLSQLVSNVPAAVMLARLIPPGEWWALALGVNLGGILLLTGSLANLIVVKLSRLGVRTYHKYALPYSLTLLLASLYLASLGIK